MRGSWLFVASVSVLLSACSTTPSAPPVPEGEEVSAGMDKEAIRQTIREDLVPIRHCYERELKNDPNIQGKLVLEWDIGDLGKVTSVTVRKSVHPKVDQCIADVLKQTMFPTPPKGTVGRVIFPFMLSPKAETLKK